MLKLFCLVALCLPTVAGRSQTITDMAEQVALDVEKLSSLKSTLQDMYDGYQTLEKGYSRVRDIARDYFNLHQAFLDALWVLSPAVRDDPRLETIVNTEYRIVTEYKAGMARIGSDAAFSPEELGYLTGLFSAILQKSMEAIDELTLVTTDNQLRMSDDQRLQALDRIDAETKNDLMVLQRLNNEVGIESDRRAKEASDIQTLKSLYGIPN